MIRIALFCGVIVSVAPALAQPAGPMLVSVAELAGLLKGPERGVAGRWYGTKREELRTKNGTKNGRTKNRTKTLKNSSCQKHSSTSCKARWTC